MLSVSIGSSCSDSIGNTRMVTHTEQPWFVLNAAKYYNLTMGKGSAISSYYSFEADRSNGQIIAVPDGCIDILFDCDRDRPQAHVCGSTMEAQAADLKHRHRYFGVRFAQGMLPDFLDVPAADLVGQRSPLLELVPEFEPVFAQIVETEAFSDQVAIFQYFQAGTSPRTLSSVTASAIGEIWKHKGDVRIQQLEEVTGFTTRTLQRQFQNDMGMSPKAYCRIVRCQWAIHEINHRTQLAFSDLACELGYSDQPHFLREFKRLVSTTPLQYQRRLEQSRKLQRFFPS